MLAITFDAICHATYGDAIRHMIRHVHQPAVFVTIRRIRFCCAAPYYVYLLTLLLCYATYYYACIYAMLMLMIFRHYVVYAMPLRCYVIDFLSLMLPLLAAAFRH